MISFAFISFSHTLLFSVLQQPQTTVKGLLFSFDFSAFPLVSCLFRVICWLPREPAFMFLPVWAAGSVFLKLWLCADEKQMKTNKHKTKKQTSAISDGVNERRSATAWLFSYLWISLSPPLLPSCLLYLNPPVGLLCVCTQNVKGPIDMLSDIKLSVLCIYISVSVSLWTQTC